MLMRKDQKQQIFIYMRGQHIRLLNVAKIYVEVKCVCTFEEVILCACMCAYSLQAPLPAYSPFPSVGILGG